tara:strand:+ start:1152 stop:1805 length:654 start_codon:yes stop_codon:yes gene_type:complete
VRFATASLALLILASLGSQAPHAPGASVAGAQASAPTLDALLDRFGDMPGMSAHFREEKRIALLAVPVRTEGVLYFTPPGRLMRKVTSPAPSAALLEGDRLTFVSDGERQVVQLGESPVLAGFVESFRYVLAGDRAGLERTYRVQYTTDGAQWKLTLRPRNENLQRFLREMTLEGEGFSVATMKMVEVSGDTTTTELFDVNPRRRFTDAEVRRFFSL